MVRLKVTVFCNISMMLLNASILKVTKITAIFTALYYFPSVFFVINDIEFKSWVNKIVCIDKSPKQLLNELESMTY